MTANQHYDVIMIIGSGPEAKTLVYGLAPWQRVLLQPKQGER